eukprot:1143963-Pelagomonas_calceolata.AAC.1
MEGYIWCMCVQAWCSSIIDTLIRVSRSGTLNFRTAPCLKWEGFLAPQGLQEGLFNQYGTGCAVGQRVVLTEIGLHAWVPDVENWVNGIDSKLLVVLYQRASGMSCAKSVNRVGSRIGGEHDFLADPVPGLAGSSIIK